jgi:hypothetical protein
MCNLQVAAFGEIEQMSTLEDISHAHPGEMRAACSRQENFGAPRALKQSNRVSPTYGREVVSYRLNADGGQIKDEKRALRKATRREARRVDVPKRSRGCP